MFPVLFFLSGFIEFIISYDFKYNSIHVNHKKIKIAFIAILIIFLLTSNYLFYYSEYQEYSDIKKTSIWVNSNLSNQTILVDQFNMYMIYLNSQRSNSLISTGTIYDLMTQQLLYEKILIYNITYVIFSFDPNAEFNRLNLIKSNYNLTYNNHLYKFNCERILKIGYTSLSGLKYFTSTWKININ